MPPPEELLAVLAPHGQQHVVQFWDDLDEPQRQALAGQIRAIDFDLIGRLYRQPDRSPEIRALADRSAEPPTFRLDDWTNRFSPEEARQRGGAALKEGRIGAMLVAGGQGTRLGFDDPKGTYCIGPVSGKTLFEIHVEKVRATARRYGRPLPLCVMTSPATHGPTQEFFCRHDRFGLAEEDLKIFCQGTMPAVDTASGRLLLDRPDQIVVSPDGHGGMLAALKRSGLLHALRGRGIEHLFYFQVDNPLVAVCDPEFLGYHLLSGSEMSSQAVRKQTPQERIGNMVEVDGRLHVIEYSDLPKEVAQRRKADGSLAIWAGSIGVHVMDLAFLDRMAGTAPGLPFHVARKKVPYIDASGRRIEPAAENALKFERFIFDLLPSASRAIVVEVDPREHFAPLKNASGEEDTPEIVRARFAALHGRWLRAAGAELLDGVPVEISPLWALDEGETAARVTPGMKITEPTYFAVASGEWRVASGR
jgi:UDP-N-acetylglucosamine/UDP-N-acetylgalactosamine diphosphorylase